MGIRKTYKCNKCSYSAEISGGVDRGFTVKTNTMLCEQCKEVIDVITHTNDIYNWEDESDIGKCENCNSSIYLKEWDNEKRPCPRCSGKLDVDKNGMYVMWD